MSRVDSATGWGKFDITLCEHNDDRSCFLKNPNFNHLLYFWQKHDECNLVEFSCAHIPNNMTGNSSTVARVSNKSEYWYSRMLEVAISMSSNVAKVEDGIKVMASMEMQRKITDLEESKMNWEL